MHNKRIATSSIEDGLDFTVGELHGFVVAELNRAGRPRSPEVVFVELRELICDQLGIAPERVVPAARFVQDLRID